MGQVVSKRLPHWVALTGRKTPAAPPSLLNH
jgi:hypothetical protein